MKIRNTDKHISFKYVGTRHVQDYLPFFNILVAFCETQKWLFKTLL